MSKVEKYITILNFSGKICGLVDMSLLKSELALEKLLRGTGYSLVSIHRYSDEIKQEILHKLHYRRRF